ncbi:MAG: ribosomal L7Ae/L30e/S12e/Gadd45 family protein [Gemmatimonadota bacterium]
METPPRPDPAERVLALLGLGAAGGNVVVGVDGTRAFLQRGKCFVVVMARDASPRAVSKVKRLAEATGIPVVMGPAGEMMGARLGRPPVMVVGVKDRGLAAGVLAASAPRDGT